MLFLSTVLLSTLFLSTVCLAETKFAFVDLGRAFDDYEKTKQLDRQLEEKSSAKQTERDRIVAEIRKMKDELELMSEQGREERQEVIDEKIKALQEFDREARESLKQERDEMVKGLLKEIEVVVQAYAGQQGYTMVLSDRAVLYAEKGMEITDEILKRLNGSSEKSEKAR